MKENIQNIVFGAYHIHILLMDALALPASAIVASFYFYAYVFTWISILSSLYFELFPYCCFDGKYQK